MIEKIERAIDIGGGQVCDVPGVLRELEKAGFVIVPREPTEAMIDAGLDAPDDYLGNGTLLAAWRAMIDMALKS